MSEKQAAVPPAKEGTATGFIAINARQVEYTSSAAQKQEPSLSRQVVVPIGQAVRSTSCLDLSRHLLTAQVSFIPIATDGTKSPASHLLPKEWNEAQHAYKPAWKPLQQRYPTEAEANVWFAQPVGIAVVCGSISGHREALDLDMPGLDEQYESLATDNGFGDLVHKLTKQRTPSGGVQYHYRCEQPVGSSKKLARSVEGDTLIETRGEAAYAVIAPSPPTCHPDHKPYLLLRGDMVNVPILTAEERLALHKLASVFNAYVEMDRVVAGPKHTRHKQPAGLRPGDDYNERGNVLELLEQHGWKVHSIGNSYHLTRPGKSKGTSATFGIVPGKFYCFTTNAAPFQADHAYSPFACYALLEHNGDFQVAAQALAAVGYGTSLSPHSSVENHMEGKATSKEGKTDLSGILSIMAEELKGLPAEVLPMGLEVSESATHAERDRILRIILEKGGQMAVWTNFALGDWFNSLPGEYGKKAQAVRDQFGEESGIYRRIKNCGWVAGQWPKPQRPMGLNSWAFFTETADKQFTQADRANYVKRWMGRDAGTPVRKSLTIAKIREEKRSRKGRPGPHDQACLRRWIARLTEIAVQQGTEAVDRLLGLVHDTPSQDGHANKDVVNINGVTIADSATASEDGHDVVTMIEAENSDLGEIDLFGSPEEIWSDWQAWKADHPEDTISEPPTWAGPDPYHGNSPFVPDAPLDTVPITDQPAARLKREGILPASVVNHAFERAERRTAGHNHCRRPGEDLGSITRNREADVGGKAAEEAAHWALSLAHMPYCWLGDPNDQSPDDGPDLRIGNATYDVKASGLRGYVNVNCKKADDPQTRPDYILVVQFDEQPQHDRPLPFRFSIAPIDRVRSWPVRVEPSRRNAPYYAGRREWTDPITDLWDLPGARPMKEDA